MPSLKLNLQRQKTGWHEYGGRSHYNFDSMPTHNVSACIMFLLNIPGICRWHAFFLCAGKKVHFLHRMELNTDCVLIWKSEFFDWRILIQQYAIIEDNTEFCAKLKLKQKKNQEKAHNMRDHRWQFCELNSFFVQRTTLLIIRKHIL